MKPGFVELKRFSWRELFPECYPTIQTIANGILHKKEFGKRDKFE
jgi:hypothetical protein